MAICAIAWLPMIFIGEVRSLWLAVAMIGLAAAAHQGWSANLFTVPSDLFPRRAVASVVGIGGFGSSSATIAAALCVGLLLQMTGNNYVPAFMIAGSAYLAALLVLHLLAPKLTAADVE